MSARYDHIVIGGGHNGLTCAAYLAKAGRKVLVLEAAPTLGGAAGTGEIAPGFRVSTCAHILNQLHPRVIADLNLGAHGLTLAASDIATAVVGDGGVVRLKGGHASGRVSPQDGAKLPAFHARLLKFARHLQAVLLMTPPRLAERDMGQNLDLLKLGWAIRSLGREDMREFLRIIGMNVYDLMQDNFESSLLQAAFAADAVLGANLGPRSPGTVLTLLYRLTGEIGGRQGALALPRGGMGAVTASLAAAAASFGATLRSGARVAQILVENDRARGVVLASGEEIAAPSVISNADPRTTFMQLLGPRHLDAGFTRDVGRIRAKGAAAKLNLALDGLPGFTALERSDLAGRILIAGNMDAIEAAFNPAKYGEWSPEPVIEITIASLSDPTLAPEGKHVLSAVIQYAPYRLKAGWDEARGAFESAVMARLERFAPGIGGLVRASQLLTPLDLERDFGMPGGHWHHGELAIDQLLMLRPVQAAARYAAPVEGVYLCGAGCHPGGGVMGAAGYNAARAVLRAERAA